MDEKICMGALHTYMHAHTHTHTHLVGYNVKPFIYNLMAIHKMLNWGYAKGSEAPWDTLSNITLKTLTHISLLWQLTIELCSWSQVKLILNM